MTDLTSRSWIEPEQSDVMKRLVDSQRALRESLPPTGATARVEPSMGLVDYGLLERSDTPPHASLLDLTSHDHPREAAPAWIPADDPRRRAERLERSLEAIHRDLNEARRTACDAIIALDDRFLEIERAILTALGRTAE